MKRRDVEIDRVEVSAFTVPTSQTESDGTLEWDATTMVVVEISAGGQLGIGYTYADVATAALVRDKLTPLVQECDPLDIPLAWQQLVAAIRNLGRPGIASMAIAAVDGALWDLKAKLLDLPLVRLLGSVRTAVPLYGSGGFTSYSDEELARQFSGWKETGLRAVKMKVGREPRLDEQRVRAAREAIGPGVDLFIDANGAFSRKQALAFAEICVSHGVSWFEEPVSSDDLEGLRLLRDRGPAGIEIAAGEYGYDAVYFRRMLQAGAVDVLQADATRCAGITGFLQVGALCEAFGLPLSAHTAPMLHAHPCCAVARLRHLEYFHDHVRIEQMFFDGVLRPVHGALYPDRERPGLGIELKRKDMAPYAV